MKEAFEIARIIQKSLKGKLSESEERQLSGWRKVSDENERAFQRMISEDFYTIGMEKLEMYDSRVAYGRFLQKKYQQRRKRRFLINMARVAAVALPFVIALVLYVGLNREEEQMVRPSLASNILPGTSKAVLTLANGQMIPLGKEATDSTIITDGTQISASGSGVTYASGVESESVVYNKLEIPRGGEFCLTLSDGTRVWLNSETSIQYPVAFGAKERRVFVQGEAYFEVAKDAKKPFTVQFMSSSVTVLGTSFNIRAYPEEKQSQTTLAEGSVRIYSPGSSMLLKPGEQAEVKALSGEMEEGGTKLMPVVAVIDDYYPSHLTEGIKPMAFVVGPSSGNSDFLIAVNPDKEKEVIEYLKKTEKEIYNTEDFTYTWLTDEVHKLYAQDRQTANIYFVFALIIARYSSSISDLPYRIIFWISVSSTSPLSCLTHCSLIERIQVISPLGTVTHFDSSGDLLITGIISIVQLPISTTSVFFAIVGILSTTAA